MAGAGKKVFVGLSGGVDSSVAAYLLREEGYEVTGVFIKVWQPDFIPCTWREDRLDAMRVAATLGIPFKTLDLEEVHKREVIDQMIAEYKAGRTPNPDVLCNREVKFGAFLDWALREGADYIATGHYANKAFNQETKEWELHRGDDPAKDQSYFLWAMGQEALARSLFPIGHLKKDTVRMRAAEIGLPTASKKDSQGLCFISNVDMKSFLKRFIDVSSGEVMDENGKRIGVHEGAVFYTLGERHGFAIETKHANEQPYFIVDKNSEKNTLTVSHTPPSLSKTGHVSLREVRPIGMELKAGEYEVETRYHGTRYQVTLEIHDGVYEIRPQGVFLGVSGQSLVLYRDGRCFGGGIIV